MEQKQLSIVTVNYKTPQLLHTCISSIYKHTIGVDFEIIVVDNNSEDESEELIKNSFPEVKWINNSYNAGFGRANNLGVKHAKGEMILLLNSDTEFIENTIKITLDYYKELEKDNKVGMLGCQLKGYDDVIQYNSNLSFINYKRFLRANPIAIKFNMFQYKMSNEEKLSLHKQNHESMWMGIAYGLMHASVFNQDHLYFDEDFFMYFDDVEWCIRLRKKGYKHYFTANTTLIHYNGGSASSNFSGWRHGQIITSDWLGLIKIYGKPYYLLCMLVYRFNLFLDDFFYLLNQKKRNLEIKEIRDFEKKIFRKYFFKILFNYNRKTSSAKQFLKFEIPKQ